MTRYKLIATKGKTHHEFIYRDHSKALSVLDKYTTKLFYIELFKI